MQLLGVQFDIAWEDRAANFAKVAAMLEQSPPARGGMVVLPEMFASGFSMNLDRVADESGETETFLAGLARQYGVYVIGGIATRRPLVGAKLGRDAQATNEAIVAGAGGNIVARYAKIHPFTPGKEAEHFTGGDEVVTFRCWDATPSGITVAPFVCYDLRFPEIFRAATVKGAQLLAVIANWPTPRVEHWTTLLKARAIENQAYVIGVNRCGKDPYLAYPGKSIIVDYRGTVLAEAGDGEEIIWADVDLPSLLSYRRELPFLNDIRFQPQMNADQRR